MIGPSRDEIDGLLTAITNINEDLTRLGLNYRMLQELTFDGACFMATCEGVWCGERMFYGNGVWYSAEDSGLAEIKEPIECFLRKKVKELVQKLIEDFTKIKENM
jgi:hypothetical protein